MQDRDGRAAIYAIETSGGYVMPHQEKEVERGGDLTTRKLPKKTLLYKLVALAHNEVAPGVALLVSTAVAVAWANSPWADSYEHFWHFSIGPSFGNGQLRRSLEWIVNDCLMVIFFFVVGIEIKKEIHDGELAHWRRAALPTIAAAGGMVFPALFYLMFAGAEQTRSGWGVPMATDIAFAVGILTLLGNRAPPTLRILLLALAVIDDLGAILVIALFYSSGVAIGGLVVATLSIVGALLMKWRGVQAKWAYLIPAVLAWGGVYASGIHPTIAGVVLGLITPVEPAGTAPAPADYWLKHLHPWVAFAIMPVFALANAGVQFSSLEFDTNAMRILLGVGIGLVFGKPVGILLVSALALRTKVATLPKGIHLRHLIVLGCVSGIGFTMSLFVAQLAFTEPAQLATARLSVVIASGVAGVTSLILGRFLLEKPTPAPRTR